ncbi:TPA: 3'-5' exonuclease [Vibrio vulnificus]
MLTTLEELDLSPLVAVGDIETLAKTPDAQIGAIGVVLVDVIQCREAGRFYTRVCLDSQTTRRVDPATEAWWEQQKEQYPEAYLEMFGEECSRLTLPNALEALAMFLTANFGDKKIQFMGNGPEFDNVILAHAYEEAELELPWHYGGNQSLRTVVWMGRMLRGIDPKYNNEFKGCKHHALHDAAHEARYLLDVFNHFQQPVSTVR